MSLSKFSTLLAASAAAFCVGGAQAATITNSDGALSPFSGFEWASGGAAWTTGLDSAQSCLLAGGAGGCSTSFTIQYAAWAVALLNPSSGTLSTPNLDSNPNGVDGGYEYTIHASMSATLTNFSFVFDNGSLVASGNGERTCVNIGLPVCISALEYSIGPGEFNIYYDTSANANITGGAWSGFDDGAKIISGNISGAGTFNVGQIQDVNGAFKDQNNSLSINGQVTDQNQDFNAVSPTLLGHNVSSTLQLFPSSTVTDFTAPLTYNMIGIDSVVESLFQADANQTFSFRREVPEPASILLAGLALMGIGAAKLRRKV